MLSEADRLLPKAIIAQMLAAELPSTAKTSKGAKELMQQCVTEFICFTTSECIESSIRKHGLPQAALKSLNEEDLCNALTSTGTRRSLALC